MASEGDMNTGNDAVNNTLRQDTSNVTDFRHIMNLYCIGIQTTKQSLS